MNMKKVYKAISKKYGVSVKEVEQEIQGVIDDIYINPNFHAKCVYHEGDKPTQAEFIAHIARRVKD